MMMMMIMTVMAVVSCFCKFQSVCVCVENVCFGGCGVNYKIICPLVIYSISIYANLTIGKKQKKKKYTRQQPNVEHVDSNNIMKKPKSQILFTIDNETRK